MDLTHIQIILQNQFLQKNTINLAKHNTEMPWDEEKLCDFERLVKIFGKKLSKDPDLQGDPDLSQDPNE